jgi:hypothetical protein
MGDVMKDTKNAAQASRGEMPSRRRRVGLTVDLTEEWIEAVRNAKVPRHQIRKAPRKPRQK